ncbi:hypothetical protein SAMN05444483_101360 [Salegentibacter echinorum]|uniref:PRC-barrel domain-containing protein n=1 Tax=Salegentibacter echinorum TaxID=1073325 RepID=A0A1M5C692_SALEC|nr:hypothetical protein [Salegentibacter echinorum]SHF50221.1 hypothetical protein SAMN05444483_101360 [Salegentibacter echinorum]
MKNKKKHLYYLNELSDYKVASNYSDVTGWSVKDKDNRVIGKVDNLLVNKDLERVVYLDVEVDETIIEANHDPYGKPANAEVHEFVNKEGENHIIIPVGLVDINNDQKFVYTNTIDHQTFAETKRIRTGANINREYEEAVMGSYKRKRVVDTSREDKAAIKKSPYKADREKEQRHMEQDSNREFTREELEREKADLKQKRKELEEERVKLEQERLLLEEERQRQDPEFWSNKKREALTDSETPGKSPKNVESHKERPNHRGISESDDSFYDREEFDGQNYRGKG